MADIRVNVNVPLIPWIKITQPVDVTVEFYNGDTANKKTVAFPSGAPPSVAAQFNIPAGLWQTFVVSATAPNGLYPLTASGGGTSGNGGIEIDR